MLKLSCHCGHVHIEIPQKPDFINECNCTLCTSVGARWAYFRPSDVSITGKTKGYSREDKDEPAVEIQSCSKCGSTTHFTLTATAIAKFGNVQTGINMNLVDERELTGVELRYPDGQSWSGVGGFGYVRGPRVIGQ